MLLSRQDLASFAGTTHETVFRIMNELVQENAVNMEGKFIKVPDAQKLLQYTRESGV